jgi:antitoxin ParD1/3/4
MASSLPSDVQQLVNDMLASGHYDSEAIVIREALRLLKQRDELKRDVRQAIADLDRGEGIDCETVFKELRARPL